MTGLEAFADAIMHEEGWAPGSRAHRNRNPGNLRPYAVGQAKDADNYRIFPSLADGWNALLVQLSEYFTGANKHGIGPESTIFELMSKYAPSADSNDPLRYANSICSYLYEIDHITRTPATLLGAIWSAPYMTSATATAPGKG